MLLEPQTSFLIARSFLLQASFYTYYKSQSLLKSPGNLGACSDVSERVRASAKCPYCGKESELFVTHDLTRAAGILSGAWAVRHVTAGCSVQNKARFLPRLLALEQDPAWKAG